MVHEGALTFPPGSRPDRLSGVFLDCGRASAPDSSASRRATYHTAIDRELRESRVNGWFNAPLSARLACVA